MAYCDTKRNSRAVRASRDVSTCFQKRWMVLMLVSLPCRVLLTRRLTAAVGVGWVFYDRVRSLEVPRVYPPLSVGEAHRTIRQDECSAPPGQSTCCRMVRTHMCTPSNSLSPPVSIREKHWDLHLVGQDMQGLLAVVADTDWICFERIL